MEFSAGAEFAGADFLLGCAAAVALLHGAVVFGAEPAAKLASALLLFQDDEADGEDHDRCTPMATMVVIADMSAPVR
jgi:hypothetical protein